MYAYIDNAENVEFRHCFFGSGTDNLTVQSNCSKIRERGCDFGGAINDSDNILVRGNLATIGTGNDPTTTDYDVTNLSDGVIITDDGTNAWVVVDAGDSNGALAI